MTYRCKSLVDRKNIKAREEVGSIDTSHLKPYPTTVAQIWLPTADQQWIITDDKGAKMSDPHAHISVSIYSE